ncbi:MAG: cation:proton antiporter [Bacteroidota bacterium]
MIFAVSIPFLNEMVALFVVSVLIAYLCYRIKIVPIVGFLIAGVIIGPNALGLVYNQELVDILAEIGIILLLFTIGIEFSLEKLARIKKAILVGGGLQVGITIGLVGIILFYMGIPVNSALYTGCLISLSSTAIILGLLSDEDKTDTPTGQLSLAILIFQDLAIIVMVLLVPILAGSGQTMMSIGWILLKALLLIAAVLISAQRIVPWILERIAKTRRQELFLLTVVAICFGTAALTSLADVSLALGAFLAGLVVSESHYSEQAISEILPLKTIFNAIFFVSVGMLLDLSILLQYPLLILGTAAAVVVIKFMISTTSLLVLRYPLQLAGAAGLTLAQIGEFSFVLERAGRLSGLSPAGFGEMGSQVFIAVSVLLMILTPFMVHGGPSFGKWLAQTPLRWLGGALDSQQSSPIDAQLEDHVIIVGYGPAGRHLVQVLSDTGIPFVVIEMNPDSVKEMHQQEIPALYGDAGKHHILKMAGSEKAKLCVIATNDPDSTPRIIQQAKYLNPTLQLIVRTRYLSELERLERIGADIVVPEEMETTVRLFYHVLGSYQIPETEITEHINTVRADGYGIVRGSIQEAHLMVLQGLDEEGLHTRAVAVREGSMAAHKTLEELHLRKEHQLTVLAVKRDDRTIANPDANFRLEPGDRLMLVGTADQFVNCAELFREQ